MDQILITRANGTVELLNSSSTVSVVTKAEQRKAFLGEDVVVITVESAEDRGFGIGDKIKLFGLSTYKINQIPRFERKSERKIVYDLTFEGLQYDLIRAVYRNEDVSSFNTTSNFTLVGDIEMYLNVLINNANRVFGAGKWQLGDFPANTETKNLLFNGENCLAVLQRICTEYGYGFVIEETSTNNILHVRKVGDDLAFSFEYGRGKGLYSLSRQKVDSKNIVNTLYVYGSDKNIPYDYKNFSERLRLGLAMAEPVLMANDSISAFGTFEGVVVFEDIFPNREASVTGISSGNKFEFTDSTMFDLNELDGEGNTKYLIPGNNAKIHFNSGNLSGYEFEVEKYVHSTRTFTVKQNIDPKGLNMPSITEEAFQIQVGDKYVIIDISMPSSYITAAEVKLEAKAEEFLLANKVPTVQYSLLIDEVYLASKATSKNVFEVGDTVQVKDSEMLIDSRIKINGFTRDVLFPYRYQLTISENSESNILLRLSRDTKSISSLLKEKKIVDVTRQKQDSTINTQIVSRIDSELNKRPVVKVGQSAENLELGNSANDSLVKVLGKLGIVNQNNFLGEFSVADLTANRVATLPDRNIEINNWDDLSEIPNIVANIIELTGTSGVLKKTGADTWTLDDTNYLASITGIVAGGDLSGTYPNPTLNNAPVVSKILTGLNVSGGVISETDSILSAFGKLQNQVNSLSGGLTYQGTWNASTNTPSITSSVGTKGHYYVVNVAGTTNINSNNSWNVGDWIIYNGTVWEKQVSSNLVNSVNGFVGVVNLTTADVSENTKLYYTAARVREEIGLDSSNNAIANFSTDLLQANGNYTYKLPDSNIGGITVLNDWNYLLNKPTKRFFFQQNSAASTWVITHGLGQKCIVQTFDLDDNQIYGNVKNSDTEIQIVFSKLETGYAICLI